jgi:hypothetical protein
MAMNTNETTTHALPCGRTVEQVWADVESGRAGPHPDCPHCGTARRSLDQLAEATRALVDDPAEPGTSLLDRIMDAVRADIGLGESIALPAPGGGVDISVHALSAVLRFAVDTVDGVRAHRCRVTVDDTDPYAVHVAISVSLRFGSGRVQALDEVRDRAEAALSDRVGLRLRSLGLDVVDVWQDGGAE